MAGSSLSIDSPPSNVREILRQLQSLGFCLDLDASHEESEKKPSPIFHRILSGFIKEVHKKQGIRPIPAFLGNGKLVDLFELYLEVLGKGGCESVTANRSWELVAERIGCHSGAGSSVKLVYFKYLDELVRCLGRAFYSNEVEGSFLNVLDWKKKYCESKSLLGLEKNQILAPINENRCRIQVDDGNRSTDDNGVVVLLDAVVANKEFSSFKRKRESLAWMLNWLLSVAKSPCNPSIGKLTSDVGVLFSQVLVARQAMYVDRIPLTDDDRSLLQGRQKIHPLIFEDCIGADNKKLTCGPSLNSLKNHSHAGSGPEITTTPEDNWDRSSMPEGKDCNHDRKRLKSYSSLPDVLPSLPSRDKLVPVGRLYQAKVPDWTATAYVSSSDSDDSKWLGTRIWPLEKKENRTLIERDPIGRGRQDNCGCQSPGSVECVRFHVGEKRLRLKLELCSAFHSWRFDCMGEEVAHSWTEEEERRLKAVVRLNPPSLQKNLWDQLDLTFPYKGRQNIVSYYFNVFVLRRRSYQNRMTPEIIDSDDDEKKLGFISDSFGRDAVEVQKPRPLCCSLNAQFVDNYSDAD